MSLSLLMNPRNLRGPKSCRARIHCEWRTAKTPEYTNAGPRLGTGVSISKNSRKVIELLLSRSDFCRRPTCDLCGVEHRIRSQMCRPSRQQLLFPINQICSVKSCQFKSMSVRNRIGRACLNAVSAKNAAIVVNVVNLGVTLGAAHPFLGRVLCCLDIDAIGRAVRCTKKTGDALLQAILIALQDMHTTITFLKLRSPQWPRPIGIIFHRCRLKHLHEGDAHAFGNSGDVLEDGHTH